MEQASWTCQSLALRGMLLWKGDVPEMRKQGEEPPTEGKEHSGNSIVVSEEHTLPISNLL